MPQIGDIAKAKDIGYKTPLEAELNKVKKENKELRRKIK